MDKPILVAVKDKGILIPHNNSLNIAKKDSKFMYCAIMRWWTWSNA